MVIFFCPFGLLVLIFRFLYIRWRACTQHEASVPGVTSCGLLFNIPNYVVTTSSFPSRLGYVCENNNNSNKYINIIFCTTSYSTQIIVFVLDRKRCVFITLTDWVLTSQPFATPVKRWYSGEEVKGKKIEKRPGVQTLSTRTCRLYQ